MTYDFFMGQLRLIAIGIISYLAGSGRLTSADASALTAVMVPLGLLAGPYIWSLYRNIGMKIVPASSIAIDGATPMAVSDVDSKGRPPAGATITALASTAKVVGALLVGFLVFAPMSARAQQGHWDRATVAKQAAPDPTNCPLIWDPLKLCGALTGKPEDDMQRVVKRIQGIGRDDMNYAILKATAAHTDAANVRLQCLNAIMDAKNAAEGASIKDAAGNVVPRPDPAFVTQIEDVAELVDAMAPGGPLMTKCAGAAQMFKTNTLAVINGIVTGAAGLAALPAGL